MNRFFRHIISFALVFAICAGTSVFAKKAERTNIEVEAQLSDKEQFRFKYFYSNAVCAKLSGDLPSAMDYLYKCFLINPHAGIVFFELATISSMQQNYTSAVTYAQRAVNANPTNIRYKRALAELLMRSEKYDEAVAAYRNLIELDSKHAENYYLTLASILDYQKDYEGSIKALDRYAELTELTPAIVEEKFKLYIKQGEKKKAFKQIDELIKYQPDNFNYVSFKAEMYCALNDTVAANKVFQKAFKENGDNPSLQFVYAKYLDNIGDSLLSRKYYMSTFNNPHSSFDVRSIALLSLTISEPDLLPDSIYKSFIREYPEEYSPYFSYGFALIQRDDTTCFDYFQKSLDINPKQEDVWRELITYYSQSSNLKKTKEVCQMALVSFPRNVDFRYVLGMAYRLDKQDSLAIEEWKVALDYALQQQNPISSSTISAVMGDLYFSMGEKELAYASYDSALVYNPENIMAMNNYAYYLSLNGENLDKAEKLSLITVKAYPKNPVYLDTYAWICFKRGEYSMASLYIEQAFNNGGATDPDLLEHYGDILFKMGEGKSSYLRKWKEALEIRLKEETPYDGLEKLKLKVEGETYVE